MFKAGMWFQDSNIYNALFTKLVNIHDINFYVSYAASTLDNFVFFVIVGTVVTFLSLKKPEEESLSRKIEFIFPDVESNSKLAKYLQDEITSLACINESSEKIITVQKISKCRNYAKLVMKSHAVIKNIHNNHQYANDKMPYRLEIDNPKPNEEILGEIFDLSLIKKINGLSKDKHIINNIEQLTPCKPLFETIFPIKLDPNQEVIYQTTSWMWEEIGKISSFSDARFSKSQCYKLINMTGEDIEAIVDFSNKPDDSGSLSRIFGPFKDSKISHIIQNKKSHSQIFTNRTPNEKTKISFRLLDKLK